MRKIFLAFLLLQVLIVHAQTLQSPDQFLGYKVGTKFTRHFKIVDYFKAVASAKPDMVKVEKYGETYEGRDLMLAFIALPENLQKLDAIRMNNLRMAGLAKDRMAPVTEGTPAIIWLSYNVHGNEPASSEAAMKVLYALVDPNNKDSKEWLKNVIIIIDPCINPDGRDRYVNWYNNAVGTKFNATPFAREHQEPWPQGRTNHYNFDLNRDWVTQTQPETRALASWIKEQAGNRHVVSMMDFHSTDKTVIYAPPLTAPSPTIDFLKALKTKFDTTLAHPPEWNYAHRADSGNSKSWALETLKAPGITVELWDQIPAADARALGAAAADALIEYFGQ